MHEYFMKHVGVFQDGFYEWRFPFHILDSVIKPRVGIYLFRFTYLTIWFSHVKPFGFILIAI